MPLRIALIIGVNDYRNVYFNKLEGAIRDAAEINGFLKYKLPVENRFETVFLNNPTSERVVKELTAIRKRLDDDSVFFFYFAGHGLTMGNSERQSLLCSDAAELTAEGVTEIGAISSGVITHFVRQGRGDMFFCLDVCRTPAIAGRGGPTVEGVRTVGESIAKIDRKRCDGRLANSWILSSCSDGQLASDRGEFAASLIDAMTAGLNSEQGIAFGDEFVSLIEKNLKARRPDLNQRPEASGRPFVLAPGVKSSGRQGTPSPAYPTGGEDVQQALMRQLEEMRRQLDDLKRVKTPNAPVTPVDSWIGNYAGERREISVKGVSFGLCWIPPGNFMMGSPENEEGRDDDEIQHRVTIDEGFWLCEVPTTQEQWDAVGVQKEEECRFKGKRLPVERVSWYESVAFIEKLNKLGAAPDGWRFALPTEEQWEYACRAGTTGSTYGVPLDEAAWCDEDWRTGSTHKVGTKKPNKWGLFDMLGNVLEWTNSKYEDGASLVYRGGSWGSGERYCRPAKRRYFGPTRCSDDLGFRCALVRQLSK